MKLIPRSYQTECVRVIWEYFEHKHGNPLCLLPTGTGKSVVIAMFVESALRAYPRTKIIVATHVKELVEQNYQKMMTYWPGAPAGINSASLGRRDIHQRIIFGGIASMINDWATFGFVDIIIIDEAHLVSPNDKTMYQLFIKRLKSINPNLKVIGFTATGWRLGQGELTDEGLFTDICFDITGVDAFNRLIAEGYLSMLIPYSRLQTQFDISEVHSRGGDYIAGELQRAVNRDELTLKALKEAMEIAYDRKKWLIFASGIEHAMAIEKLLKYLGMTANAVHSKMSGKERDQRIKKFREGKVQVLIGNNIFTTGFDVPEIDCIIMLRWTESPVLWVQMLGRGTRPVYAPGFDLNTMMGRLQAITQGGKLNCLVLDYAGNTKRLGPINDPRIPKKKGKGGGEAPIKECPYCGVINHASARHCIYCGKEFEVQTKLSNEVSTEELIRFDAPVVEVFKVDSITYHKHEKADRPLSIKVSYMCGFKTFTEYVCMEYTGAPLVKAQQWWKERDLNKLGVPKTVDQAMEVIDKIRPTTHLRVWTNKRYPEILKHCLDGSAFGTEEAKVMQVEQFAYAKAKPVGRYSGGPEEHPSFDRAPSVVMEDDEIPF